MPYAGGVDARRRLEIIRAWRSVGGVASPIAETVRRSIGRMRPMDREIETVRAALEAVCPADLVAHIRVGGVTRGVLRLSVDGAPLRFRVQRWLAAGGEAALRAQTRGISYARVRVELRPVQTEG